MTIELPDGDFDAYIFDCDGTLADSMPMHYRAWMQYGIVPPPARTADQRKSRPADE